MFGSLVQRLQSLSPLTSPTTSPSASPKAKRKFGFGKSKRKKDLWKDEVREVQSEPEDFDAPRKDKRKISAPVSIQYGMPRREEFPFRRADEPYPANVDVIYDVPARIQRRVGYDSKKQASKTMSRVEGLKKADRLLEYEQYFASLLIDTHPDHPEFHEISKSRERLGQLISRRDDDSELERIQELFPNDNLRLYERDPIALKMKGLVRKKSTTAARLHRAFSAKGLRGADGTNSNKDSANNYDTTDTVKVKRAFIMETPIQFTTGVQSQERHLFLFTDLLLVAKARSGGNFKLKEKVRVSEMWLANCLDDVAEISKSPETSFVVGWPITNVIASFSCVATKDLWYNKLSQVIADEREREPSNANIQVTYYDILSNTDICKTINISSTTTARDCVHLILDHLEMGHKDPSKFELWVKSSNDDAPYPLIGHEYPFAIKMNSSRYEYETDCHFILRQDRSPSMIMPIKKTRKPKKSPMKIHKVFKRSNSKGDITDSGPSGVLYGHHLSKICDPDGSMPRPVMEMLHQLFMKGPFTDGIFRKSANARLVKELKEKLNMGMEEVNFDNINITAIAALLKDFLRSLPDCLLSTHLYDEWLNMTSLPLQERVIQCCHLSSRMDPHNQSMLQYFLCVLYHISRRSSENMMSSSNLAVCVGPSILWPANYPLGLTPEASKQIPCVVEFLIERCQEIFGNGVLVLFGDPPETDPFKQDSGAEESDSLHSGHSMHSSAGIRRDDSSIDSLEREFLVEGELSPLPRKEKLSLTNLSRDSGLTLSDSQLYTADEEENESTSSSNSGDKSHIQVLGGKFQHYTAPNNPDAIYTAVLRRPDKIHIAYDELDKGFARYSTIKNMYVMPNKINIRQDLFIKKQEEESIYSVPVTQDRIVAPKLSLQESNFQRHDWARRKSNTRKLCKTNSGDSALHRSNSEESLLNKYNTMHYGMSFAPQNITTTDDIERLSPRLSPYIDESYSSGRESPLRRSKSAHQIIEENKLSLKCIDKQEFQPNKSNKWKRSKSSPHIHDEGEKSYDSSTLSDDDSTPHVSRSNSRGKEWSSATLQAFDDFSNSNGFEEFYKEIRDSSFKSDLSSSMCTVVSAESTSTLSSNPPSYEETLSRRSAMLKPYHKPEYTIKEEKVKSARAKQLYEESLRIYQEENSYPSDLVHASPAHTMDSDDPDKPPPLPPKSDVPPLPPKQKLSKRSIENRLRHHTPIHVDSSTQNKIQEQITYAAPVHKTIIYTTDNPPNLPPKEKTIIEVNPYSTLNPERKSKYQESPQMKSIETQTDECGIEEVMRDEGIQTSGPWSSKYHVITVPVNSDDRKSRPRRKRNPSNRSRSMPGREDEADENWEKNEYRAGSESKSKNDYKCNFDYKTGIDFKQGIDSDLQQEISWSVSQLRTIFGDSLNGAKVHPPPYRPPPSARNPPTFYYGNGECRKMKPNYAEESYV